MSINNVPNTPPISTPGKLLTIESIGQFLTNLVNSVGNAFTNDNIAINALIADDNTNIAAIATNTANIATNTTNISTNTTNIAANTAAIAGISVPSLPLSVANGGTGNAGGAWTTYTPTITSQSGTISSVSAVGAYNQIGKTVSFEAVVTITTAGTGGGFVGVSLPNSTTLKRNFATAGAELGVSGSMLSAFGFAGASALDVRFYNTNTAIASGAILVISGTYEAA